MSQCEPVGNEFRYERKFAMQDLSRHELEAMVRLHPAAFSEIYHHRCVNNIYLDWLDCRAYLDAVEGARDRTKVRIRWYGELFTNVHQPVLEIKIKRGLVGTKRSFPLRPFSIGPGFEGRALAGLFADSELPPDVYEQLRSVTPVLANRYTRQYFRSADRRFRITIDWEMLFYRMQAGRNSFCHGWSDPNAVVLELKYNRCDDEVAPAVVRAFALRLTKSSKYVSGLEALALA